VKKGLGIILLGLVLLTTNVSADEEIDVTQQNIGSQRMASPTQQWRNELSFRADWIGPAKVDKKKFRDHKVKFYNVEVQGERTVYQNATCREGITLGLGYSNTGFHLEKNPFFKCDNFNMISLTLGGYSGRVERWLFQGYVTINWQYDYQRFPDYSNYDLMLWSRYEYCPNIINIHAGFLIETGMKIDRICPIIGFDWKFYDKWKLNAVFPVNLSVVYDFADNWSAALAGRLFNVRYRLSPDERLKEALLEYYNYGIELGCSYQKEAFYANIHAGITLGGEFKISNREHKHKKHFDMDSAPYVGGEIAYKF
jgi:hypothetical protein